MAKPTTPPKPKDQPKAQPAQPDVTWFESREKEPSAFHVCGIRPIRNFSNGKLEWEVPADKLDLFKLNHFVRNNRIILKPVTEPVAEPTEG